MTKHSYCRFGVMVPYGWYVLEGFFSRTDAKDVFGIRSVGSICHVSNMVYNQCLGSMCASNRFG